MVARSALFSLAYAAATMAAPSRRSISKRWTDGVDCTSDTVATEGQGGLFFAITSDGATMSCDDAANASAAAGNTCYQSLSDSGGALGQQVQCPQDPAPAKNPDGTGVDLVDASMETFCDVFSFKFISPITCFTYGYYAAHGDPVAEIEAGAKGLCDALSNGLCTWFIDIEPFIAASMSRPCVDDPGSNACAFAGPSK